jgi:hypothetical protein
MTADDLPEDEEVGEYEPLAAQMADGDVLVMDPVELCEIADALALQVRDGALFLLKRNGCWVNVEDALKPSRGNVVQAVRTKQ